MIRVVNRKKFTALLTISIVAIALVLFRLVWGSGTVLKTGEVTVAQGEVAGEIWRKIVTDGYADRTIPWKYYARQDGRAAKIQAGTYHIEKDEKISEVVRRLAAGDTMSTEFAVTFPEGFRLTQIAARYADRTGKKAEDFVKAATVSAYADRFPFLKDIAPSRSLEGYLFPDTYRITPDDTPDAVILRMLGNFDKKVPQELRDEAVGKKRSLDEIIDMASIIEKEVRHPDDMAMVSGILWKRIDDGTGLYADATLEYVLDKNGALTVKDLEKDTPYNTRKYRGLPPTPINSPGLQAILAALRPAESDYYYYLTTKEGDAIFAKTNDEHNRNKAKYLN